MGVVCNVTRVKREKDRINSAVEEESLAFTRPKKSSLGSDCGNQEQCGINGVRIVG